MGKVKSPSPAAICAASASCPGSRRWHQQKLNRPDVGQLEAYPQLQPVLTRPIKWDMIRHQYDEIIKYVTVLQLAMADAEALLRRFTRAGVQKPTSAAMAELGKVYKTIFLCEYLRLPELRREMHEGLNVVENWNSANGFIFYGHVGDFATNQREDAEVTMLCLHLLQISLVYIDTPLLQRVLAEERRGLTPPHL